MVTQVWARLESRSGVEGPDPAWKPQRQFLWEVIHDTRGVWREAGVTAKDLELLRTIDDPAASGGRDLLQDPKAVASLVARLLEAGTAAKDSGPRFRLVGREGKDDWAVVQHFEHEGQELALVGGWTGPVLRRFGEEPDATPLEDVPSFSWGENRFRIRAVPFVEYFRKDLEALEALAHGAQARGLRIRFLQR